MKCSNPRCGEEIKPGWKACPMCQAPVIALQTCSNCKEELQPNWQACPFCMTPVQGGAAPFGNEMPNPTYCRGCGTELAPGTGRTFKCDNCRGVFCLDCRVDHPDGKVLPICESCGHDMLQTLRNKRQLEVEAERQAEEARRREEESRQKAAAEEKRRQAEEEQRRREEARRSLGIIPDPQGRSIEWYVGPDRDINWNDACTWVKNLTADGGGWRMPTIKELKGLYEKGNGKCNMSPDFGEFARGLLKIVWSGETKDSSSAWNFYFLFGEERWDGRTYSYFKRVFAVRSRG